MSIDTVLTIIGTFVGVFGLVTGYIFYRKSLRIKEPCISYKSTNLVQGYLSNFSGLEIRYNDITIPSLTITKIMFWNNGRETIDAHDFVSSSPIKIVCVGDVKILDVKVLCSNNVANQFSCVLSDDLKSARVNFEYLDYHQGAVIQVIHTGVNQNSVGISGMIKGSEAIKYKDIKFSSIPRSILFNRVKITPVIRYTVPAWLWLVLGGTGAIVGLTLFFTFIYQEFQIGWTVPKWFFTILFSGSKPPLMAPLDSPILDLFILGSIPFIVTCGGIDWILRGVNLLSTKIPNGLEIFED